MLHRGVHHLVGVLGRALIGVPGTLVPESPEPCHHLVADLGQPVGDGPKLPEHPVNVVDTLPARHPSGRGRKRQMVERAKCLGSAVGRRGAGTRWLAMGVLVLLAPFTMAFSSTWSLRYWLGAMVVAAAVWIVAVGAMVIRGRSRRGGSVNVDRVRTDADGADEDREAGPGRDREVGPGRDREVGPGQDREAGCDVLASRVEVGSGHATSPAGRRARRAGHDLAWDHDSTSSE